MNIDRIYLLLDSLKVLTMDTDINARELIKAELIEELMKK